MGPTVLAAVDRACRSRDSGYLAALAQAWSGAVPAATEVGFVHGDLTADNAIVRPKEGIAYVDYDTAYWPDAPSVPRLDPAAAYRHPRGITTSSRNMRTISPHLLIYMSLRILAVWPELAGGTRAAAIMRGAGLLFQPRDLAHPDGSPLFGKLRVVNDAQVQGLVGILREACLSDPDKIPTFAESLALAANVAGAPVFHSPTWSRVDGFRPCSPAPGIAARESTGRGTDRLRPSRSIRMSKGLA